jgi:hypothetical protein
MKRPEAGGFWGSGLLTPIPANAINSNPIWQTPERIAAAGTMWANSIQPYTKNYDIEGVQGLGTKSHSADATGYQPGVAVKSSMLTMNGLMHCVSSSEVVAPSTAILAWCGLGNQNVKGRAISNPGLDCRAAADCHFNPGARPSSDAASSAPVYVLGFPPSADASPSWIFDKTAPVIRADTSAKSMGIGTKVSPAVHNWPSVTSDPWAQVDTGGYALSYWPCGTGHTTGNPKWDAVNYPCYFRPDRTE